MKLYNQIDETRWINTDNIEFERTNRTQAGKIATSYEEAWRTSLESLIFKKQLFGGRVAVQYNAITIFLQTICEETGERK